MLQHEKQVNVARYRALQQKKIHFFPGVDLMNQFRPKSSRIKKVLMIFVLKALNSRRSNI
jgi:hypothetical protein